MNIIGNRTKAFFIFLFLLLFFFVGSILILLSFVLLNHSTTLKRSHGSRNIIYQYQEVQPNQEFTNTGLLSLPNPIVDENENFISYPNPQTGSLFIISKVSNSEFTCTGVCSCENHSKRRSTLTRTLTLLLTAFSTPLALKIAHESFLSQCQHQLSSRCSPSSIHSEVHDCTPAMDSHFDEEDDYGEEFEMPMDFKPEIFDEGLEKGEELEFREYDCHGHCLPNKRIKAKSAHDKFQGGFVQFFGECEDLEYFWYVRFYNPVRLKAQGGRKARQMFRKNIMNPFCSEISAIDYEVDNGKGGKVSRSSHMCVASRSKEKQNVKCTLRLKQDKLNRYQ